jgi:hypothetical protein
LLVIGSSVTKLGEAFLTASKTICLSFATLLRNLESVMSYRSIKERCYTCWIVAIFWLRFRRTIAITWFLIRKIHRIRPHRSVARRFGWTPSLKQVNLNQIS